MKRYLLIIASFLVMSVIAVSIVSAAVIFPQPWPSKEMPQEKPPVLTPGWGHFNPPLLDVPPAPPETPKGPNYGWIAHAFVLCRGVCYDELGPHFVSTSATKDGTFCHIRYPDAKAESEELLEQAKQECMQNLAPQCSGRLRFDIFNELWHFYTETLPRQCMHEPE